MSDDTKALMEWLQGRVSESRAGRMYKRALDTIERLERDRDALAERCEKLREALQDIADPLAKLRREADEQGMELNMYAHILVKDAQWLRNLARTALAAPKDAP